VGRPRSTWLRMIDVDDDVQPQNFGVLHTALRKVRDVVGGLATSRQHGNALLGVRYQEEEREAA